jgi:membrane-associated phospholipid phosphatase
MKLPTARLFLIMACLLPTFIVAQSPYRITKADIAVGISAAAFAGVGHLVQRNVAPLTPAILNSLDPSIIPRFDRFNVGDWRPKAATVSDFSVIAACAAPFALFADKTTRHDFPKIALLGAEAGLITYGFTNTTKGLVGRTRPYTYGQIAPLQARMDKDARLGFFSGHTSITATATFFAAQVYADYHPESKWRPLVWAGAALAPAAVGYLRVRAGKHFLSDVVTGYALGAASGLLVPILHHRRSGRDEVSLSPSFWGHGSGVQFCWRW